METKAMMYGYDATGVVVVYSAMGVLALLGIVGNVLSIVVWTRQEMKSTSAILLTVLGFSDAISILSLYPRVFLGVLLEYDSITSYEPSETLFDIYLDVAPVLVWMYPIFCVAQTMSTYMTLAITVERYIAMCYPFQYQKIISYCLTLKVSVTVTLFSIAYNLPRFWFKREHLSIWAGTRTGFYNDYITSLYDNPLITFYMTWLDSLIVYLLPLAAITICNTTTFIKVKTASRKRRGMATHQNLSDLQKKENRLTVMLIYVVFEFLICSSINGLVFIANAFHLIQSTDHYNRLQLRLIPVGVFFELVNSSANFVSYVTFGKPFRRTLKMLFSSCCQKEPLESPGNQE